MLLCIGLQVAFVQQNKNFGQSPKRKVIKMKKFASVLLAVLVAFSMFSFVVSAAAPSLTVKTDKSTVKAGETVKATVSISEKSNIGALTVDLVYDATAFEVVSLTKGTTLFKGDNDMEMTNKSFAAGKARYIGIATEAGLTAGGVVFTVELKALTDAKSTISLDVVESEGASGKVTTNSVVINDKKADETTTKAPETTTKAPETTTAAPETTTKAPETTTAAPESSTAAPETTTTAVPETSTAAPESSTDAPTEHVCTWSTWATTNPTCKEDGFKVRNCTVCGHEEREAIPATGVCVPTAEWETVKAATATEKGQQVKKCTMCGEVMFTRETALVNEGAGSLDKPSIPNTDAIA